MTASTGGPRDSLVDQEASKQKKHFGERLKDNGEVRREKMNTLCVKQFKVHLKSAAFNCDE